MSWTTKGSLAGLVLASSIIFADKDALADEIHVECTVAAAVPYREFAPLFEQWTGHKLITDFAVSATIAKHLSGADVDVVIAGNPQLEELDAQAKLVPGSHQPLAKNYTGIFVRHGALKPDIRTERALKTAMLQSASIGYTDPALGGSSGVYIAQLIQRLGLAEQLTAKVHLASGGEALNEDVKDGRTALAFLTASEIGPEVDLVGPLPAELDRVAKVDAGVLAVSGKKDAANAFLAFLTSPEVKAVFQKYHMQPQ